MTKEERAAHNYRRRVLRALYGPRSIFTAEEQAAMRRGYTRAERIAISGQCFNDYAQAISLDHANKLDAVKAQLRDKAPA